MLVWKAMSSMTLMMHSVFLDDSLIEAILVTI
jgi:hypothetical protein